MADNSNGQEIIIPGVDAASGIARFAGKKELFYKSLNNFVLSLPDTFDDISKFTDPTYLEAAKADAHTKKGVAGNLSMTDLYHAAVEFEHLLKEGSISADDYTKWQNAIKSAKQITLSALASRPSTSVATNTGTKEDLSKILYELLGALAIYQATICEKCAEKLKEKSWAGVDKSTIDAIVNDINSFEYENATEKINKII